MFLYAAIHILGQPNRILELEKEYDKSLTTYQL